MSEPDLQSTSPTTMRFQLAKTGLYVSDIALIKKDRKDRIVATIPLTQIERVAAEFSFDAFAGCACAFSLALAVVAKRYIPSEPWSWVAAIVLFAIAAISFAGRKKQLLVIESCGQTARYEVLDDHQDGASFAIALQLAAKQVITPVAAARVGEESSPC